MHERIACIGDAGLSNLRAGGVLIRIIARMIPVFAGSCCVDDRGVATASGTAVFGARLDAPTEQPSLIQHSHLPPFSLTVLGFGIPILHGAGSLLDVRSTIDFLGCF